MFHKILLLMTSKHYINKRLSKLNHVDCHLYCLDLDDISNAEYVTHYANLNNDEAKKAKEYLNYKLSSEFTLCRSICKELLALALKLETKSINFKYTENEKPYLENHPIHFNISHSKHYALIAISDKNIGVDIEFMDKDIEIEELMKIFAYEHEKQWVLEENSLIRFYTIWTIKEAILKFSGEGITAPKFPYLIDLGFPGHKLSKGILHKEYAYAVCS